MPFLPLRPAVLAAVLALTAVSLVQAQQGAAPAAPQLSPAHLTLAREVVVASGIGRAFEGVLPALAQSLGANVSRTRPEVVKDLGEVVQALRPEFDTKRNEMLDATTRIFAARIGEAELRDISAFFKSAAGQKYVAAQPAILDAMFVEMQGWTQRAEEFLVTRVREELQKRGHSF